LLLWYDEYDMKYVMQILYEKITIHRNDDRKNNGFNNLYRSLYFIIFDFSLNFMTRCDFCFWALKGFFTLCDCWKILILKLELRFEALKAYFGVLDPWNCIFYPSIQNFQLTDGSYHMVHPRENRQKVRLLKKKFSILIFFCPFAGIKKQKYGHTTFFQNTVSKIFKAAQTLRVSSIFDL
jgi:hypothetical protein